MGFGSELLQEICLDFHVVKEQIFFIRCIVFL